MWIGTLHEGESPCKERNALLSNKAPPKEFGLRHAVHRLKDKLKPSIRDSEMLEEGIPLHSMENPLDTVFMLALIRRFWRSRPGCGRRGILALFSIPYLA